MSSTQEVFPFLLGNTINILKEVAREGGGLTVHQFMIAQYTQAPGGLVPCDRELDQMTGKLAHALSSVFQSLAAR